MVDGPMPASVTQRLLLRAGIGLLLPLMPAALQAQAGTPRDTANGWNATAVRGLMERVRLRRQQPRGDTALTNYSAKATGNIYFYLDRPQGEERTLVKVNQIALQLFWARPNLTKQKIVGLRDANPLPNRMYYHLDHLTVVQNGFSDVIRIGEGDEVRDVRHPAAPLSDSTYDFRLADSTIIAFPAQEPVHVYEVQVRPRDYNHSALIGSLFIDKASADIVRMTFTFTPASYVDRRLDYINISLDNGLWSGRYWLPNEQYVEIRRQIPELDFAAGAVIRGRLRVYDYQFNQNLPRSFFYGSPVEAVPEAERKAFKFDENIFAGLDREGLSSEPPQIATLRAQALELVRQKKLSGLPSLRPHVSSASSVLRYNNSEGTYAGIGLIYTPQGLSRYEANAGYSFGEQRVEADLRARNESESGKAVTYHGYFDQPRDMGLRPALPPALNTLSSAFFGRDYLNLYFVRGGEITLSTPVFGKGELSFTGGFERQGRADFVAPLRFEQRERIEATEPGNEGFARLALQSRDYTLGKVTLSANIDGGASIFKPRFTIVGGDAVSSETEARTFARTTASLAAVYKSAGRSTQAQLQMSHGEIFGEPPFQQLFILGGLGTIPGAAYRGMIGKSFTLVEGEVARDIKAPWLRVRATGSAGFVNRVPVLSDSTIATYNKAASIGVGVGLFWDILRLDVVRGRDFTRFYFNVRPDLWDLL